MASHDFIERCESREKPSFDWSKTKVTATRLTAADSWVGATESTTGKAMRKTTWFQMLDAEHSPIRSVWFRIRMENIPSFVSVHLVRHKIGVEPYVESNREDRSGEDPQEVNRLTPVLHTMDINAQALMTMARRRLCLRASQETRKVMEMIKWRIGGLDEDLASLMVPTCEYRGGVCHELKSCGRFSK